PEPVTLEQHPDALAPFADAVEAAVQIEVLERRQLAIDQRLVPEVADLGALGVDGQLALGRDREPCTEPEKRRLAGPLRACDDDEAPALDIELDSVQHDLLAEALAEVPREDHRHVTASSTTNTQNATLMTPFIVKNAASSRRRSPGRTSECS